MKTDMKPNPQTARYRRFLLTFAILTLTAITALLWPGRIECALGQCGQKDQWCNPDCSQGCGATAGSQELVTYGTVRRDRSGLPYCLGGTLVNFGLRCENDDDCNVTSGDRPVYQSGGYSYVFVNDQQLPGICQLNPHSPLCRVGMSCSPVMVRSQVDCCSGGSGTGPCTPVYAPPAITLGGYTPPYPIVIGQDPDEMGLDVTIQIAGGGVTNGCPNGVAQQTLTRVRLEWVRLADSSVAWINNELALVYPGAQVKGRYPFIPTHTLVNNGTTATLTFHLDPLDPGLYDILVYATQADGQETRTTLQVPAHLLEATITK